MRTDDQRQSQQHRDERGRPNAAVGHCRSGRCRDPRNRPYGRHDARITDDDVVLQLWMASAIAGRSLTGTSLACCTSAPVASPITASHATGHCGFRGAGSEGLLLSPWERARRGPSNRRPQRTTRRHARGAGIDCCNRRRKRACADVSRGLSRLVPCRRLGRAQRATRLHARSGTGRERTVGLRSGAPLTRPAERLRELSLAGRGREPAGAVGLGRLLLATLSRARAPVGAGGRSLPPRRGWPRRACRGCARRGRRRCVR